MKREVLFRTCVFGGYNKEDVMDYVYQLESELESLKNEKQDVTKSKAPQFEDEGNVEGDKIVFDEQMVSQPSQPEKADDKPAASFVDTAEISQLEEKLKKSVEELEQVRARLREKEEELEKTTKALEEKENQIEESSRGLVEFRKKYENLKQEHERYEKDYDAIKNVLLNARVDAGIIVAKAQEKARLIMEEAQKNAQLETHRTMALLVDNLKENQEGLDESRSCLERQLKGIKIVKQQIEEILTNVETMCEQAQNDQEEDKAREDEGPEVTINEEFDDDSIIGKDVTDADTE